MQKRHQDEDDSSQSQATQKKKSKKDKEKDKDKDKDFKAQIDPNNYMATQYGVPFGMPYVNQWDAAGGQADGGFPYAYRFMQMSPHKMRPHLYDYSAMQPSTSALMHSSSGAMLQPSGSGSMPKPTKRFFMPPKRDYSRKSSSEEDSSSDSGSETSSGDESDDSSEGSSDDDMSKKDSLADKDENQGNNNLNAEKTPQGSVPGNTDNSEVSKKDSKGKNKKGKKKKPRKTRWSLDQKQQLVDSYSSRISLVRGKFKGGSGGRKKRKDAWKAIAGRKVQNMI